MRHLFSVCLCCFLLAIVRLYAEPSGLLEVPFWRVNSGWWVSDNTYFDGDLNYNIRAYNSIVHVDVRNGLVIETEHKFYPPGKLAAFYGAGKIGQDEGIEVVTVSKGRQIDTQGSVRFASVSPLFGEPSTITITALSADSAFRTVLDPVNGLDSYRMLITLPVPDKRYVASFGLVSSAEPDHLDLGGLRGFSLFRGDRLHAGEFDRTRARLRAVNKVRAVVTGDESAAPQVQLLE